MGIENNSDRNQKDLEEMLGTPMTLKRNNWESKGILIGPSMALRSSRCCDSVKCISPHCSKKRRRFRPKSRGADGNSTQSSHAGSCFFRVDGYPIRPSFNVHEELCTHVRSEHLADRNHICASEMNPTDLPEFLHQFQ